MLSKSIDMMLKSLEDAINNGDGKIVGCDPSDFAKDHYHIRIEMPDGTIKLFPNLDQRYLQKFLPIKNLIHGFGGDEKNLQKESEQRHHETPYIEELSDENEEQTENTEAKKSKFTRLMENNGVIIDYHKTKRGTYAVHVRTPSNQIARFSNISVQNFEKYKTDEAKEITPDKLNLREHHPGDTFEKVMKEGGHITDIHKFETYSVYIKKSEGYIVQFGNISKEALDEHCDHIKLQPELAQDKSLDHSHRKGDTFDVCVQDPNSIIIDIIPHPFYSVHVKSKDGKLEYYSHISEKLLNKYYKV
nr:15891_t:CDS:2 [Entrophospora candida]CAG8531596.1 2842_t:CDS:2 [Entrophospora candida]